MSLPVPVSAHGERLKTGGIFVSVDANAGVSAETVRDILYRNGGQGPRQTTRV